MIQSQWNGKRVAFLGDSITDACHVGTAKNYWQFLGELLGIEPLVYGLNGQQWLHAVPQAEALARDHKEDVDAILILLGTNDFNNGVPLGQWFDYHAETVNSHGHEMCKLRRSFSLDANTLCGRINLAMSYLKRNFSDRQIVLLTPIHRGFAEFGGDNVQPEESFPNDSGLFVEEYAEKIKEAGPLWSVPVIDLFSLCGLMPTLEEYGSCFHDAVTDRLHPSLEGHLRMAETIAYQLLALPATFRR